jgi:hypothetical protein
MQWRASVRIRVHAIRAIWASLQPPTSDHNPAARGCDKTTDFSGFCRAIDRQATVFSANGFRPTFLILEI